MLRETDLVVYDAAEHLRWGERASGQSILPIFDPRRRSLVRGNILVFGSIGLGYYWSGFPEARATFLLLIPLVLAMMGTADTIRCLQKRWNCYHAGVLLLIYADLMAVVMLGFLLTYPYVLWISRP